MKTVILSGGYGTRIRDVANDIPKPMITIGRLPILWHIMKYFSTYNFCEFILCLGYKGQIIKDFFLNYESQTRDCTVTLGHNKSIVYHTKHKENNWRVTLSDTGDHSMTGARISKIKEYIETDENFFLTYGDGLSNVNLSELLDYHISHKKILTITGVRPPARFGEIQDDSSGRVLQFNEKPQANAGWISGGFFVCNRKIFSYLNNKDDLVFEEEPMKALVRDQQIMLYRHEGFWQCMDTYRDWKFLNSLLDAGKAPWITWEKSCLHLKESVY